MSNVGLAAKAYLEYISKTEKELLKRSNCLLFIGIEQRYPRTAEFEAIVDLINTSLGECTLLLADTLQRYPIGIDNPNIGKDELYEISFLRGKIWFNNHISSFQKISIPYKI